jgi:3-oxoacyl-[acyl-carrier protein] reductase
MLARELLGERLRMQVRSKTVVITGAGRGIGRALARRFAGCGANLALIDLNAIDLAETRTQSSVADIDVRCYTADVSDEVQVGAAMEQVANEFGCLDVVINNAGIVKDAPLVKVKDGVVVSKMTLAQWQAVIDVNLTGVFMCAREAAAQMIKLGNGGVINNISSISRHGNRSQTNYAAAKAGVTSMTVVWAKELARAEIRVGAIAPGFIRTGILASMKPEFLEEAIARVPLRRLGEPDEIAHAAQFIVNNELLTEQLIDVYVGFRK